MSGSIKISICTYVSGDFDVMIEDDAGRSVAFSGNQRFGKEETSFMTEIAPPCVWTEYQRLTPED